MAKYGLCYIGFGGKFFLKRRPARAHQVLLIVMIAAVIVPTMSVLVKHLNLGVFAAQPALGKVELENGLTVNGYKSSGSASVENTGYNLELLQKAAAPPIARSVITEFNSRSFAIHAWIASSLILVARLLITFILGIHLLRQAIPLSFKRIEEAARLAKAKLEIGRDVNLYYSNRILSPVIWCWRKNPCLLVPNLMKQSEDKVDWISVLSHELAHWKRRDQITGLLAELVVCILPWNPLLWWSKRRLVGFSEQACDDWVIATGSPCTDYADSLLNLTPAGNMAFVPAVVRSKKGLAQRVKRILRDSCKNPRTGFAWALAVTIGKRLSLSLNKTAWGNLSWLSKLHPDAVYRLRVNALSAETTRPDDRCMQHIAHLTGLKSLNLGRTGVTDRGLQYINKLQSLEYLALPARVTNKGLAYVAELPSLKGLYFSNMRNRVTNTGLRHLAKLTSLEELYLIGQRMGDVGLERLRGLPRLKYLALYGESFTDKGMVHVKDMTSLRILSFHESLCRITDAGLAHISEMPNLEILCLHGIKDITDDGIAHLTRMSSLRKLEIGSSQVTDKGLAYLSQIKTLERIDLPQDQHGITDTGLTHLGMLPNLRHLAISRIHFNDPKMNKEYYTDKGQNSTLAAPVSQMKECVTLLS